MKSETPLTLTPLLWFDVGRVQSEPIYIEYMKFSISAGIARSLTFYIINEFHRRDTVSSLQNLYFYGFFDIVGCQYSLTLNYPRETTINSYFLSHHFAYDISTHIHKNPNHLVDVVKLLFTGIALKMVMLLILGMENPLR